jgi:hypothetical protein
VRKISFIQADDYLSQGRVRPAEVLEVLANVGEESENGSVKLLFPLCSSFLHFSILP